MDLQFNDLPKAVASLQKTVNNIERLLLLKSNEQSIETDRWFNLKELCDYLPDKPVIATVYGWVHTSAIPCHKGQKKLRFLKSEIDQWLMCGKRKPITELAVEADTYLLKKKRGKMQ